MTEAEKNEIVGLVMTEISSQAVDFDITTEQPQANDLLTAVRETESGGYRGVTIKWDDVARIATELANQSAKRAEQAKTDANNILEQVQSKGTEITNFVATSKAELETQKNESVNAVQSVYQTDLNELKGDLIDVMHKTISTDFIDVEGYKTYKFHFKAGKSYKIEVLDGVMRLYTRKTENGTEIDTIFGTNNIGKKGHVISFTPTTDTDFIRLSSENKCSFRIYSTESLYSEISNVTFNNGIKIENIGVYQTYYYPFVQGETYYVEVLKGKVELNTFLNFEDTVVDKITDNKEVEGYTVLKFTASANSNYLRVTTDTECTIIVCNGKSAYASLIDRVNSELISSDEKFDIYEYTADDFTKDTYYNPKVGNMLSVTPQTSGAGNMTFCLKINKGETFVYIGCSADKGGSLGISALDQTIEKVIGNCSNGFVLTADKDIYVFLTTTLSNFKCLKVYNSFMKFLKNGYRQEIYAPYPQLSADGTDESDFNSDNMTTADIYAYLDRLVVKYPNLIKKEFMGNDATNTYPVNRYVIADRNRNDYLATIFIGANEHGPVSDPRECAIIVSRFAKDLCEGHAKDNKFLNILKKYFRVVIIPVQNPYGFDNNDRYNGNGVDINRNYATVGWETVTDSNKGSSAGSEVETQYIMQTLDEYNVNVALDIHCLGNVKSDNDNMCHYAGAIKYQEKLAEIVNGMMRDYGLNCTSYGKGNYNTTAEGDAYFNQKGINGLLIEFQSREGATTDVDTALHTSKVMEANYTFMLRVLNMLISDYNNMYDISLFD